MEEAYREAHQNVWPEIIKGGRRAGIQNYSIFMSGRQVFSYFEVEDLDRALKELAADPVNQAWQKAMAPLIESSHPTEYLDSVFHMD